MRQIYDHTDTALAKAWVAEIVRDFADESMPLEVRRLGRTIKRWRSQIVAWHASHVSNGPTEAVIIWSGHVGVFDVVDDGSSARRGRVIWSPSPT